MNVNIKKLFIKIIEDEKIISDLQSYLIGAYSHILY